MTPPAPPQDVLRLFLALWPDAHTRQQLQAWQAAQTWPAAARPTHPHNLHLTLHFLGQVPETRLVDLLQALPRALPTITLPLTQLTVWPNGVAALVPDPMPPALLQLHQQLATVLDELGLPRETRAYQPHVTLARRARGLAPAPAAPLNWTTQGYVLALSSGGYHVLQHYR